MRVAAGVTSGGYTGAGWECRHVAAWGKRSGAEGTTGLQPAREDRHEAPDRRELAARCKDSDFHAEGEWRRDLAVAASDSSANRLWSTGGNKEHC